MGGRTSSEYVQTNKLWLEHVCLFKPWSSHLMWTTSKQCKYFLTAVFFGAVFFFGVAFLFWAPFAFIWILIPEWLAFGWSQHHILIRISFSSSPLPQYLVFLLAIVHIYSLALFSCWSSASLVSLDQSDFPSIFGLPWWPASISSYHTRHFHNPGPAKEQNTIWDGVSTAP